MIRFRLSKVSHVGIVVVHDGHSVFLTSASFGLRDERLLGTSADAPRELHRPAGSNRSRRQLQPDPRHPAGLPVASARARLVDSRRHEPAHDPLHRQGRRREDLGRRLYRPHLRRGRPADAGDLDRSGAQSVGVARGRAGGRAATRGRPAVGSGGQGPGGDGAPLGRRPGLARRAVHRARGRPHLGRGADRPAGDGRAVLAASTPGAASRRRVGRDHRRLRAHRRDPAAALLSRRRALVDREGLPEGASDPGGGPADRPLAARHPATEPGGVRGHPAALGEPDRDERDPPRPRALAPSAWS